MLADEPTSRTYLQTLWQVVAATLALSIAMIGFVFEAFTNATQRSLGGSFREFARRTGLQATLSLGFVALVIDGIVLLNLGTDAPRGWAAAVAIGVSGATIGIALPFVFAQTIRSLEFDHLAALRRRQVERLAREAMIAQLVGQVGDGLLENDRIADVGRALLADSGQSCVTAPRAGLLWDVRTRQLRKLAQHRPQPGEPKRVHVLVSLGGSVGPDTKVLATSGARSKWWIRGARRTLKIKRRRANDEPRRLLIYELEQLHEASKAAIRDHRKTDWALISDIYLEALLALPRAAAAMNVGFSGPVAAPGPWQVGPVHEMQRFLYQELEIALQSDDRDLALEVAYFPVRVARQASQLNAHGLVAAMLGLYPMLYKMASG